ncbi:MAG: PepSY domain-containing protein [Gammaproteobacteria bacterium]|nr:PepSY domain-containing protein [Gammaproteobacteria bacterium]
MRRRAAKWRPALRRIHFYLGLVSGGVFVLLGLTGSVLVFYPTLDEWLHPQLQSATAQAPDFDRALATLRASYPDKDGPWRLENTGRHGVIPARYYDPPERAGRAFAPMMVWLSADGTQVLRRDYWGEYAMTFIYDLHYRLLLEEPGAKIVGYGGLVIVVSLATGVAAWWPRGQMANALRFKPRAARIRRMHDIHKLTGLTMLPLLLLLTLTGVMLAIPDESDAVLHAMGMHIDASPTIEPPAIPADAPQLPPARAIAIASESFPGARVAWIETPASAGGYYRLRLQVAGDPSYRFPHSFLWLDPHSGAVLGLQDARLAAGGTIVNNWLHSLHDGSAAGLTGRLIVCTAGLLPGLMYLTGLLRWYLRRQRPARTHRPAIRIGRTV